MRRFVVIVFALFAIVSTNLFAQNLTLQQLQALKAHIDSSPDLAGFPADPDGAFAIATALNLPASPTFIAYRKTVSITEVGLAMRSVDIAGLSTANTNRLQVIAAYSGGVFYPANQDTWDGFNDIFSVAGAATTRANLFALRKRQATRFEKIFATGSGTEQSPATLVVEGLVTYQVVQQARAL